MDQFSINRNGYLFGKGTRYKQSGFGLVEAMVAMAVIVVTALLVAKYFTSSSQQQISIRNAEECQLLANSIVSSLKTLDNNNQVDNWLPKLGSVHPTQTPHPTQSPPSTQTSQKSQPTMPANQTSPPTNRSQPIQVTNNRYIQQRMQDWIYDGFQSANDVEKSLVFMPTEASMDGTYSEQEKQLHLRFNNYQLIYNASNLLNFYYKNKEQDACNGFEITPDADDYLANVVRELAPGIKARFRINHLQGQTYSCQPYSTIPINADYTSVNRGSATPSTPNAPTTPNTSSTTTISNTPTTTTTTGSTTSTTPSTHLHQRKQASYLSLSVDLTYESPGGTKTCSANHTFSAGSDINPPKLNPQIISMTTGFNEARNFNTARVFCGSSSAPTITFNISQKAGEEQAGTQYLCRLDYEGRQSSTGTVVYPFRTSGWFLCSIPSPISNLTLPNDHHLQIINYSVIDGSSPSAVQIEVGNWVQGTYRFHVKAIDVAQNHTTISQKFMIDTTRPNLALKPPANIQTIRSPERQIQLDRLLTEANSALSSSQKATLKQDITAVFGDDLFQCNDRSFYRWAVTNTEALEVSPVTIVENYHPGSNLYALTCDSEAHHVPTSTWAADGPHTLQTLACDFCGEGRPLNQTWYIETEQNFTFIRPQNLANENSSFVYHAGNNNFNPYAISYENYQTRTHTISRYPNLNFPPQSGIGGACSENRRGRYCYMVADGCGRLEASENYQYRVGNDSDMVFYCPTFTCAEDPVTYTCPASHPISCDCVNDSNRDLRGSLPRKGRYYGNPDATACTYIEAIGSCCRPPKACQLADGSSLRHEEERRLFDSASVTCGTSCDSKVVRCTDGELSDPLFNISKCSALCCPTPKVSCREGSPGCVKEYNGAWCKTPDS